MYKGRLVAETTRPDKPYRNDCVRVIGKVKFVVRFLLGGSFLWVMAQGVLDDVNVPV